MNPPGFEKGPRRATLVVGILLIAVWGVFYIRQAAETKRLTRELEAIRLDLPKYEAILRQMETAPPAQARVLSRARPEYEKLLRRKAALEAKLRGNKGPE